MDTTKSTTTKIFRPIRTNYLTQEFGQNKACAMVVNGYPVSPFRIISGDNFKPCPNGYAKFYPLIGLKGHNSTDWATWHGEPLYFPVKADTAWYSKDASDLDGGLGVDVYSVSRLFFHELPVEAGPEARRDWEQHNKTIRVKFRFWHLKEAWKDEEVFFGEYIGKCDNTGASSNDHLHGPAMKFVNENDRTFDTNNGYYGCVDYMKIRLFENIFVLDQIKKERVVLESKIIVAKITLIERLYQLISLLQIQILKAKKKVGGFIK